MKETDIKQAAELLEKREDVERTSKVLHDRFTGDKSMQGIAVTVPNNVFRESGMRVFIFQPEEVLQLHYMLQSLLGDRLSQLDDQLNALGVEDD